MAKERREKPLRSDAQQSRAALLAAARELFAERGPEALTIVAVAKRAGLNRSTAYQHFRDREQLVGAVGAAFAAEIRAMFREPRPLGEQVDFFVDYFRNHPDIARLWMFQLLNEEGENDIALAPAWGDYLEAVQRLADSPLSQDGIDAEMLGVIGLTSALVWSLMVRQRTDDESDSREQTQRFSRELKRLFLFGALRPEHFPNLDTDPEPDRSAADTGSD